MNSSVRLFIHSFIHTISRTFFHSVTLINLHRQHHFSHNNSQVNEYLEIYLVLHVCGSIDNVQVSFSIIVSIGSKNQGEHKAY